MMKAHDPVARLPFGHALADSDDGSLLRLFLADCFRNDDAK
jgi:hypothetical protein